MSNKMKNFNHFQWYKVSEGIYTLGINEDGLEDITEINSIDIPPEQEKVDTDIAFGSIETDDGTLDLMSPVAGTIIEINTEVLENPEMIIDDPLEEGWILRIEATEELDEDEEDSDDDDDADDDDIEEDEEDSADDDK